MTNSTNVKISAETLLRGVCLSEEFDCDLGDKRRTARVQRVAAAMAEEPARSFPDVASDPAEQEALYRLLRNPAVTFEGIFAAHRGTTAARARALGEVLVLHDTTTFMFPCRDGHVRDRLEHTSTNRQGFYGHLGLVVSPDGLRAPLGVVHFEGYVHDKQVDEPTRAFWDETFSATSEGERWLAGMNGAEEALTGCRVIHVADREADRNDVLHWATDGGPDRGFVVRATRRAKDDVGRSVDQVLAAQPFVATRTIKLNARSLHGVHIRSRTFPERPRRQATLSFRATAMTVKPFRSAAVALNVVEAVELEPPSGEAPIRWVLFTGEPIDTLDAILRIVDIYRSRWLIEEYFKAIKTGCGYSKRQLDSAPTLLVALALTLPMAWQLLALRHLSRYDADVPATSTLTPLQIALLRLQFETLAWSETPTVAEACRAIARLGGHHRHTGAPGWQTLGRGLQKLLNMEMGAKLALAGQEQLPFM